MAFSSGQMRFDCVQNVGGARYFLQRTVRSFRAVRSILDLLNCVVGDLPVDRHFGHRKINGSTSASPNFAEAEALAPFRPS